MTSSGTTQRASDSPAWRLAMADHLEAALRRHVVAVWFPRSIDREAGGFNCDFDRAWRPSGPQERMLEFQSRQTRTAARLAMAYPAEATFAETALHGLQYLRDVMWDHSLGGWFWRVDRDGAPLAGETKHAHGTAYAVGACLEVWRATGSGDALSLARAGCDWLDATLRDDQHGGYHGWARRDGSVILHQDDVPAGGGGTDPLGHAAGLKDVNVHSDLLEMFTLATTAWQEPGPRDRLDEMYVCCQRFMTPQGGMHYAVHADWSPVPGLERYGYPSQTAHRLVVAAPLLGRPVAEALSSARRLVDHVWERAWADGRGVAFAGPAASPDNLEGHGLIVPSRSWWVQTEALKALLFLGLHDDSERRATYLGRFLDLLAFVEEHMVDRRCGGWHTRAVSDRPAWQRAVMRVAPLGGRKGGPWKDASHEGDFYLEAVRMLRGTSASGE